jgi:hypothetical protein
MSVVLVIIGLLVGGVLVGQNLIAAAGLRATISQIEKYNTAANTFRGKYDDYLTKATVGCELCAQLSVSGLASLSSICTVSRSRSSRCIRARRVSV